MTAALLLTAIALELLAWAKRRTERHILERRVAEMTGQDARPMGKR